MDLRSLALVRIGLGAVVLYDLLDRARDFTAMYTDAGVLDAETKARIWGLVVRLWPHNWLSGTPSALATLFVVHGLVALGLLVGWRTRAMTVLAWLLALSLGNANRSINSGGDVLLWLVLFWSMFLPLGARFSLDARRDPSPRALPNAHLGWPGAALLLQIAFMYFFTAIMKATGQTWRDGTAFTVLLQNRYFLRPLGAAMPQSPAFSAVVTYGTLILEFAGPLLMFSPVARGPIRTAVFLAFVAFHATIELTMHVALLSWTTGVALLALIPGWLWDRGREAPAPPAVPADPAARARDIAIGFGIALVLLINLCQLPWAWATALTPPQPLLNAARALGLMQRWTMFAPDPRQDYCWWVLAGTTESGDRIDLFRAGRHVSYDEPPLVSEEFPSRRWLVYYVSLQFPEGAHVARLGPLARYISRTWNAAHPDRRVRRLSIEAVHRVGGGPPEPPKLFYEYDAASGAEVFSVTPIGPGSR